jgi:hypothetical protein
MPKTAGHETIENGTFALCFGKTKKKMKKKNAMRDKRKMKK